MSFVPVDIFTVSEYYQLRFFHLSPSNFRSEIIAIRSERDKLAMEANFAREKLEGIMKESERKVIYFIIHIISSLCGLCFFKLFTFSVFILEGRNERRFGKKHRVHPANH